PFIPIFFFFSSRRRHTRSLRDWSSDVCSSDLAEAERPYADQVGGIADLAGRVARQGELRVPAAHPFAVVAHPNQGLAAVLDLDADPPGARVEGVFHELLHDGRRPLDHFPRSDLVGDLLGQDRDLGGQSRTTSEPSTQPRTPSP